LRGLAVMRPRFGHYGKTGNEYKRTNSGSEVLRGRGISDDEVQISRAMRLVRAMEWFSLPIADRVIVRLQEEIHANMKG
jgi:hypothetical protein